jgi:hypothetical protein
MELNAIKNELINMGFENSILFENPSYEDAIIGISDEGRVCYSYSKMIESLANESDDEDAAIDAEDFISYNTLRALEYMPKDIRPIVVNDLEE